MLIIRQTRDLCQLSADFFAKKKTYRIQIRVPKLLQIILFDVVENFIHRKIHSSTNIHACTENFKGHVEEHRKNRPKKKAQKIWSTLKIWRNCTLLGGKITLIWVIFYFNLTGHGLSSIHMLWRSSENYLLPREKPEMRSRVGIISREKKNPRAPEEKIPLLSSSSFSVSQSVFPRFATFGLDPLSFKVAQILK